MYNPKWLLVLAIVFFVLLLLPVVSLVIGIGLFPVIGKITLPLSYLISSPALAMLATSLELAVGSALMGVILAVIYCWFVARTDLPLKKMFELLPLLALAIPLVIKGFAWNFLLNTRNGIINELSRAFFGHSAPIFNINTPLGVTLVLGLGAVPLSYLIIMPAMKSIDTSFEESSRVAGHGPLKTLYSVTLRLLLPAIASAFLLALIGGLANFDFPYVLGQGRIHTFATQIYYWTNEFAIPSYGNAGLIGIFFVFVTSIGVGIYIWVTRKSYRFATITGKTSSRSFQKLGKWKALVFVICFGVIFFEFILPFLTIFFVSTTNVNITGNILKFNWRPTVAYIEAVKINGFFSSLGQTIKMAVASALITTLLGTLVAFATLRTRSRVSRLMEYVTSVPLAIPPIVYSIAIFWMFLIVPGFNDLYGTIYPLVIALTFIRIPFSTRIVSANLIQVSNELEEASQVSGARFSKTFARISMPLVRNGLVYSFVYVLVDSLRELGGVVILVTPGAYAFTALLLEYWSNSQLSTNVLAAGSMVLILVVIAFLVALEVLQYVFDRNKRRAQSAKAVVAPMPAVNA